MILQRSGSEVNSPRKLPAASSQGRLLFRKSVVAGIVFLIAVEDDISHYEHSVKIVFGGLILPFAIQNRLMGDTGRAKASNQKSY